MHKLPHLIKNRFGVYYLRLARNGQEVKRSLRTKDFRQARLLALAFNLELAMKTPTEKPKAADFNLDPDTLKRLDVVFPDGTQVKDIQTDDDVRRAKDLFGDRFATAIPAPLDLPVLAPSVMAAIAAQQANSAPKKRGKPFADVVKLYVKEKALDNTARTIVAKERAFADFQKRQGERPIGDYTLDDAVAYKNALIAENASASRVNAKLSFLRDLFGYAVDNGHRDGPNPFETAKVSSKSKLKQQKRSYKPFSADDISTIFDPAAYTARMDKPGYRWLPFLALYSGARLEELARRGASGSSTFKKRRTPTLNVESRFIASSSNPASSRMSRGCANAARPNSFQSSNLGPTATGRTSPAVSPITSTSARSSTTARCSTRSATPSSAA
jgi:hypothetical protein